MSAEAAPTNAFDSNTQMKTHKKKKSTFSKSLKKPKNG